MTPVPADYLKKSDYVLKMDSETWASLYVNAISLSDSTDSEKVTLSGEIKDVED